MCFKYIVASDDRIGWYGGLLRIEYQVWEGNKEFTVS